ncbi:MAG: SWIM zinc finger domain-containing protein, partial [Cytophagaceae bacterium]|nr:SWIM zinc finger domain-containing protein [Cytophagaceae bacterium]
MKNVKKKLKKPTGKKITGKEKAKKTLKKLHVSHVKKPEKMSVTEWQSVLRKQIAQTIPFRVNSLTDSLAYGDYKVFNPATNNSYKVALRSRDNSRNFCTCYDFKTNRLGTCKHIEAVFIKLNKNRASKKALQEEYLPPYSSLYVDYRSDQAIRLRIGTDDAKELQKLFQPFLTEDLILSEAGYDHIDSLLEKACHINPSFRCYEDALEFIIRKREIKERKNYLQEFMDNKKFPPVSNLKVTLF